MAHWSPFVSPLPAPKARGGAPLTSVAVVCAARDGLATLAAEISAFVGPGDSPRWTIEYACEHGFAHLLQRLVSSEIASNKPLYVRSHVFSRALALAVKHDNAMALLECLFAYCPSGSATLGMEEAARLGKLNVLKWITDHDDAKIQWSLRLIEAAATRGHIETLEWLLTKFTPDEDQLADLLMKAMHTQQLAVVTQLFAYADKRGVKFAKYYTRQFLEAACQGGSLSIVQFLHAERKFTPPTSARCIYKATACGSMELIEWLYATGYRTLMNIDFRTAAEAGRTDILRWMLATYPSEAADAYRIFLLDAVTRFNGAVLQLLYEHKPEVFTADVLAKALIGVAASGDLDALEWLVQLIRARTTSFAETVDFYYDTAMDRATREGHLDVAQ